MENKSRLKLQYYDKNNSQLKTSPENVFKKRYVSEKVF